MAGWNRNGAEVDQDLRQHGQVDGIFCTVAMTSCRRAVAWAAAQSMLSQLPSYGVKASIHHWGALAGCLETARRWEQALQLIKGLQLATLQPSQEFIGAILGSLEKAGRWEACVFYLHRAELVDVIAFNTAIVACGKGGRWRDALTLLGRIRSQKLKPTVVSYSSAIRLYILIFVMPR